MTNFVKFDDDIESVHEDGMSSNCSFSSSLSRSENNNHSNNENCGHMSGKIQKEKLTINQDSKNRDPITLKYYLYFIFICNCASDDYFFRK